jgi:hypothetical protein
LEAVLLEWIERLERCITINGDYTDWPNENSIRK